MLIIFLIFLGVIFVGSIIVFLKFDNEDFGVSFFCSVLITIVVAIITGLPMAFVTEKYIKKHPEITERIIIRNAYIYSLEDNTHIVGNFTLGSGSIKETPVYTFYYKNQYGYKLGTTSTEETYIEEIPNNFKPDLITVITKVKKEHFLRGLYSVSYKKLRVPKGTIVKRFNLDSTY